jgi:hypothetical protein
MKKIVRLTESDLTRLVKRSINELRDFIDKKESGWKPTGTPPKEFTSYDLEDEDFSEIEKPAFGGGSDRQHMIMRKAVRDITRKLNDLIGKRSWSEKTFDTITMIDDMLKDM